MHKYTWAAWLWTLCITVFLLTGSDTFGSLSRLRLPYKDKYVHFAFHFVFTLLWYLHFRAVGKGGKMTRLHVFALALVYGTAIEGLQNVMDIGRSADIADVLANASGSAAAVLTLWLFERNRTNKKD